MRKPRLSLEQVLSFGTLGGIMILLGILKKSKFLQEEEGIVDNSRI